MILVSVIAALVLVVLFAGVRIANQYDRAVVFRLGRCVRTSGPGLGLLIPFVEWQVKTDLRPMTTAVAQPETIIRNTMPIKINAMIWRRGRRRAEHDDHHHDAERIRRDGPRLHAAGAWPRRTRLRRT